MQLGHHITAEAFAAHSRQDAIARSADEYPSGEGRLAEARQAAVVP